MVYSFREKKPRRRRGKQNDDMVAYSRMASGLPVDNNDLEQEEGTGETVKEEGDEVESNQEKQNKDHEEENKEVWSVVTHSCIETDV